MFPVSKLELGELYVAIASDKPSDNLAFNYTYECDYDERVYLSKNIWMPEIGDLVTFSDGVFESGVNAVVMAVSGNALGLATILVLQRKHIVRAEFTEIIPALIVKHKSDDLTLKVNTNYQFVSHDITQVLEVVVSRYTLGADVQECGEFIKDAMYGLNKHQVDEVFKHLSDESNSVLKKIMLKYNGMMLVDELNKSNNFSS